MVDAGGQPLGPPVIATIPRDPTPFAAIVSGRQMFHTSEMFGKNSVIPSLVEEAMKAVQAGFQEGECYEDIAMGALVALEHLGDPNIAAERTLEEKRRRFNMLVDWFEQYVRFQYRKGNEFNLISNVYVMTEIQLHRNENIMAFLEGYRVMDGRGNVAPYEEWCQVPDFEALNRRRTPTQGASFCRLPADAERTIVANVAGGVDDLDQLWSHLHDKHACVESRMQNLLNFMLSISNLDLTLENVFDTHDFESVFDNLETAYNYKHKDCGDRQKLQVNLFLEQVLQQYFLQLVIAGQLTRIALLLKGKMRGDSAMLEQVFREICTVDPDGDPDAPNELRTCIGLAAAEGPEMDFYIAKLQGEKRLLTVQLEKSMGALFSSQKTVLNLTLRVRGDAVEELRRQGVLHDGYLTPAVQVTGELVPTMAPTERIERTLMSRSDDKEEQNVPSADEVPKHPENEGSVTDTKSSSNDGGERGGTILAAPEDMTGLDEAGAPIPPEEKLEPRPWRLEPLPNRVHAINVDPCAAGGHNTNPLGAKYPDQMTLDDLHTMLNAPPGTSGPGDWICFESGSDSEQNASAGNAVAAHQPSTPPETRPANDAGGNVRNLRKMFQRDWDR
jgi:hypothetical protein